MRRTSIILPFAVIFVCAALYIAVIPGRVWYSQITQRPRLARYATALGLRPEQHLVTGTKYSWVSSVVVEHAFYLLPRNTDWSTFDAKLAMFDLPENLGSYDGDLESAIRWVAGRNGLSTLAQPRVPTPIGQSVLYLFAQKYSRSGRIGVRIYDTRIMESKLVIDGKDLDDYYVLVIDAGECQYGADEC